MSRDMGESSQLTKSAEARSGLKGRLASNFGGQVLTTFVTVAQQILLVPLFISFWGAEVYRDWLILFAAAGFFRLFDLGLYYYFFNYLSMALAQDDQASFDRAFRLGGGVYATIIAVATGLLLSLGLFGDWRPFLGVTVGM